MSSEAPLPKQEFKQVEGHLSLEESAVQQLQEMAKEATRQAATSMLEVRQTAYAQGDFELEQRLADLEKQTLSAGIVHLGDYWASNDANEWHVPITTPDGVVLCDSFRIDAFNIKNGLMLGSAFGPEVPFVEDDERYFEYLVNFIADFNVTDQDLVLLWSSQDNAVHPDEEELKAKFRSQLPPTEEQATIQP